MKSSLMSELKEYLRIDGEEENQTLSLFLHAAQNVIADAGVSTPADPYEVDVNGKEMHASYRVAVMMLATHYYENRLVITPTIAKVEQTPIPYGLESIILQLKYKRNPLLPVVGDVP